jgi:hypothetical protein
LQCGTSVWVDDKHGFDSLLVYLSTLATDHTFERGPQEEQLDARSPADRLVAHLWYELFEAGTL